MVRLSPIHTAPVDDDGLIANGHEEDTGCWCGTSVDWNSRPILVTHHDPEWKGLWKPFVYVEPSRETPK